MATAGKMEANPGGEGGGLDINMNHAHPLSDSSETVVQTNGDGDDVSKTSSEGSGVKDASGSTEEELLRQLEEANRSAGWMDGISLKMRGGGKERHREI